MVDFASEIDEVAHPEPETASSWCRI